MVSICEHHIQYSSLCLLIVSVVYNEWSLWNWCSAPCGITGVRYRTRGCHSTLFGLVNFNAKCDTGGEEKENCVGACPHTTTAATLYPGIHSYIYTYLGIHLCSYKVYNVNQTYVTPAVICMYKGTYFLNLWYPCIIWCTFFFLQRSLIYTAKLKGVKRNM